METNSMQGKFDRTEIDLNLFNEIEMSKGQLQVNFSVWTISAIKGQMKDLFSLFKTTMIGYLKEEDVKKYVINGLDNKPYNLYDYESMIDKTSNRETLRFIDNAAISIFNMFKQQVKVALPMERKDPKFRGNISKPVLPSGPEADSGKPLEEIQDDN